MSNVKFKYFGDTSKAYTNVITVASCLYKHEGGYAISFGYCFSNKKDRYNKKVGRDLALENKKHIVNMGANKPTHDQIDCIIFDDIMNPRANAPSWVIKIINEYNKKVTYNSKIKNTIKLLDFAKTSISELILK